MPPIFYIWDTGLMQVIDDLWLDGVRGLRPAQNKQINRKERRQSIF